MSAAAIVYLVSMAVLFAGQRLLDGRKVYRRREIFDLGRQ